MDKKFLVDREILFYAFRYALGRKTSAPSAVIDNIKFNIFNVSTGDIKAYIKEIKECEYYGMDMDKADWLRFVDFLDDELSKRK